MSRMLAMVLICLAGCLPLRMEDGRAPGTSVSGQRPSPPPPPVSPKQVTPDNARDVSSALWDEMDRAEQVDLSPQVDSSHVDSPAPKKKK